MPTSTSPIRIGIYGVEPVMNGKGRGCGLWAPGYAAALQAAGAIPVVLPLPNKAGSWGKVLPDFQGVVFLGGDPTNTRQIAEEKPFCEACRSRELPFLAVDAGLQALTTSFGGTLYLNLAQDLPHALQHRHPPEKGLRHAVNVAVDTRLAELYGQGEIIVNSEHRRAVCRVPRGFRVSALALDGVIEAIEAEADDWFALGVQWQPGAATASGLDIQLFRGLVDACRQPENRRGRAVKSSAA